MDFFKANKKELQDYYNLYMSSIESYISDLEKTVRNSPGFEKWSADFTPDSLILLNRWFRLNVKTRKMSKEEIDAERESITDENLKRTVEIEDWEFTDDTKVIIIKIGMYFGEVFIKNNPTLKWHLYVNTSRNNMYFGQPVISGFEHSHFAPLHMIDVQASKIVDERGDERSLYDLYQYWIEDVK